MSRRVTVEEADVFAIAHEAGQFCVQVFFFRAFQNWGNHAFRPAPTPALSDTEVLEAFISQFYEDRTPPRRSCSAHEPVEAELLEEALTSRLGRPQGRVESRSAAKSATSSTTPSTMRARRSAASSPRARRRRRCSKASPTCSASTSRRAHRGLRQLHISGTNAVGAMIVAGEEGSARSTTAPSTSARPTSPPATISA
jgi:excinuclease ABC subunit C